MPNIDGGEEAAKQPSDVCRTDLLTVGVSSRGAVTPTFLQWMRTTAGEAGTLSTFGRRSFENAMHTQRII